MTDWYRNPNTVNGESEAVVFRNDVRQVLSPTTYYLQGERIFPLEVKKKRESRIRSRLILHAHAWRTFAPYVGNVVDEEVVSVCQEEVCS